MNFIRDLVALFQSPVVGVPNVSNAVAVRGTDGSYEIQDTRPFQPAAQERAGTVIMYSVTSWINHVLQQSTAENDRIRTLVFFNPSNTVSGIYVATAVLDYHGSIVSPQWARNKVQLVVKRHPLYELALDLQNWRAQDDFAQYIRKCSGIFASPDQAGMLQIARELRINATSRFSSQMDDNSGSVNFVFQKTATATIGTTETTVAVPEFVEIVVPMLLDSSPTRVSMRLEYRAPESQGDKVKMRLVFDDQAIAEYGLTREIRGQLTEAGLTVLDGATP